METWITIIGILAVFFVLLSIGVPIAASLGLIGFLGTWFLANPNVAFVSFGNVLHAAPRNYVLLAIPLFVMMAEILNFSGTMTRIFDAMDTLFSSFRGGLAMTATAAGTIFAALSGSSVASCACIGPLTLSEMSRRKVNKRLAAGAVAAAGGLAIIIPPSGVFIMYGFVTDVSVVRLFMAGLFPGLMMALTRFLIIFVHTRLQPSLSGEATASVQATSLKVRTGALLSIWPLIALAVALLVVMYVGIATPTEAAAIGVLGALVISVAERAFDFKKLMHAAMASVDTAGFVGLIIVGAFMFGFLSSYLRIPAKVMQLAVDTHLPALGLLFVVNVLFLILGCFLDAAAIIFIAVPVVAPALLAAHYDPVWLGVLLCINIEMGLTTPPVGLNLFVLQGVGKPLGVTYWDVVAGAAPFLLGDLAVLVLMVIFPQIALWLPNTMLR